MLTLLDTVARRLVRHGVRRGVLEGNPIWIAVLAVALLVRLLARPQRPRVQREKLRLGETLTVRHVAPGTSERGSDAAR